MILKLPKQLGSALDLGLDLKRGLEFGYGFEGFGTAKEQHQDRRRWSEVVVGSRRKEEESSITDKTKPSFPWLEAKYPNQLSYSSSSL
ncbi:hypothetical protein Ddye_009304 [Dipteronia dyeriana]|uniref:Uncharacterized protein n=1 Tax=Dipteronia dyeriana TaxID=168575 RepID=A0AAD9XBI0_9ROSI|nr:hypothetical protein Ddye_009304 [Dipteronia dyeriana]